MIDLDSTLTTAVGATVLTVAVFAASGPSLGRRLPPALATRLLVPAGLGMAGCTVFVLGVLAFTWVGQQPAIAALGRWSAHRLDAAAPVPDPLAAISLLLLAAVTVWTGLMITGRARALTAVYRAYHGPRPSGDVMILDNARPDAFATPAPAGRIVVTTSLWQALTPAERRVVLAHERSHLAHRHTWWTLAADLAAAVNPLLRPTATVIGHAVERWAGEDAARAIGDRELVARTIANAALLKHHAPRLANAITPATTGGDLPQRVRALLSPPPHHRPPTLIALTLLLAASTAATVAVQHTSDQLFVRAGLPSQHTLHHPHGHHHSPN